MRYQIVLLVLGSLLIAAFAAGQEAPRAARGPAASGSPASRPHDSEAAGAVSTSGKLDIRVGSMGWQYELAAAAKAYQQKHPEVTITFVRDNLHVPGKPLSQPKNH